ncbi:hypothetical protein TorRG33x02_052850 [Trema orientale]|uniref:Uncharacterized protein n=1 Tax=Trema orientale TaxID=63057 RepID=A0A2P5FMM3_TREOI|nr:hypothetical protein TorRG33x02_052850 [Trema orientale]
MGPTVSIRHQSPPCDASRSCQSTSSPSIRIFGYEGTHELEQLMHFKASFFNQDSLAHGPPVYAVPPFSALSRMEHYALPSQPMG